MSVPMKATLTVPGPRARVGIPQNRFKAPSNGITDRSKAVRLVSDLKTGLFHIIIVDNYDGIPDDLVVKVILARNRLHLVAASMSTYDAQITW